ncbi:acyl-coenzyme A thioesteras-like protein 13 [Calycina marina]|uniref:Acyl-coenzyme A thioesteras-like protein 13 n=1 Tax=Calycina marina TaxID=1763456 RepID=A0A9P8CCV4_9HELO|nr:acyl-coenzyme A thioesteras-like protein 13 [Calycina marina]
MEPSEIVHVRGVAERMKDNSPIYDFLLSNATIISATKGRMVANLLLEKQHINSRGTIHGAVSATVVDWSGGLVIATHGLENTGASIDIHVTYIGGAQIGDTIEIVATANKVGRSVAFTTIRIYKLVDGQPGPMVATASHTKYISQATTAVKS